MKRVIMICGRICSGKSYYARKLKEETGAVILSTDEVTFDLIHNEQGEFYNIFAARVNRYLRKKAAEIVKAGANVILDWGFWTENERKDMTAFFREQGIATEWVYIDISPEDWKKNISERNARIESGNGGSDFYVDEGLLKKLAGLFEEPEKETIDRWVTVKRSE